MHTCMSKALYLSVRSMFKLVNPMGLQWMCTGIYFRYVTPINIFARKCYVCTLAWITSNHCSNIMCYAIYVIHYEVWSLKWFYRKPGRSLEKINSLTYGSHRHYNLLRWLEGCFLRQTSRLSDVGEYSSRRHPVVHGRHGSVVIAFDMSREKSCNS